MKLFCILSFFIFSGCIARAQLRQEPDSSKKLMVVEAACGQCMFGLEGITCDLSVKINGTAMFVDGTGIDDHGDAHEKEGFCNAVRKAEVQGEIINNRFRLTYFKLLQPDKRK